MPDYQKLYTLMFNAVTDALEDLFNMNYGTAKNRLLSAEPKAEGLFISQGGDPAERDASI